MSDQYKVCCDCKSVEVTMAGSPNVHAFCHCEDCRDLLQVPYHSVTAWNSDAVVITKGADHVVEFQHPEKRMKRIFCRYCGEVLFNTNAMGWKLVSQLLVRKCNQGELPEALQSSAHFFYGRRIVDVEDQLPKRE